MENITVRWYGPYRLDRIEYCDASWEYGIYSIYRQFGSYEPKLMYIGQTTRVFVTRIREHHRNRLSSLRGTISIRFGVLELDENRHYSKQKLDHVESLLIQIHKPPMNIRDTDFYRGRQNLIVTNVGRRGLLERNISARDDLDWT